MTLCLEAYAGLRLSADPDDPFAVELPGRRPSTFSACSRFDLFSLPMFNWFRHALADAVGYPLIDRETCTYPRRFAALVQRPADGFLDDMACERLAWEMAVFRPRAAHLARYRMPAQPGRLFMRIYDDWLTACTIAAVDGAIWVRADPG